MQKEKMSRKMQHAFERQALMDMVEEAVKDVLADKEVIEYIRELMSKQVRMIMENEAVKRAVQGLVDKVVGDLRLIMAKQVQKLVEERVLIGSGSSKEILNDSDKMEMIDEESLNELIEKQTLGKNDLIGKEGGIHREKLYKRPVASYDVGKNMNDEENAVKEIKSSEQVTMSVKQINKQAMNLLTRELDPQSADKKKAVKDLRKLMNMIEEVVNGAVDCLPDREVVDDLRNLMHGGEQVNKAKTKIMVDKVRDKIQVEDVGNKYVRSKKGQIGKQSIETGDDEGKSSVEVEKKTVTFDDSVGEPLALDVIEECIGEDGMEVQEILRLKKIIHAMNRYVVGDTKEIK